MPEIEEVTDVPEEETVVPGSDEDLARFFLKVKCTKEEALTTKHLQWGWKELGKEDGAALAFVIRNNAACITLDLFVNEIYEEAGALVGRALKDNVKLKTLDLQQAQIGVEGGRAIAEASGATRAHLAPCPKPALTPILARGQALRKNVTLMNLKLYYNCLGPAGTKVIAEALQAPQPCAHVASSGIGPAPASPPACLGPVHLGCRCAPPYVRCARAAQALRLRCSGWPATEAWRPTQRDGAIRASRPLAIAPQVNTKLTNLDLGDNGIALQGCQALAAMLGLNTTLARLGAPPPRGGHPEAALGPWPPRLQAQPLLLPQPLPPPLCPHPPPPPPPPTHLRFALTLTPTRRRADVSKNAGVQGDEEAKGVLREAEAKRKAPLNLLMIDEPGQRWSVDGFVDVVEWTR